MNTVTDTKRVTKSQQVRSLVKRFQNLKNADTAILNKTLELGLTKPLAKTYIKNAKTYLANEKAGTLPKRGRPAKQVVEQVVEQVEEVAPQAE